LHDLLTHTRFLITLRSQEGTYHSLILFRLSTAGGAPAPPDAQNAHGFYAMESTCPHLGADMSHAEIEECETSLVAVCPWHRYDFDLRTGKSETGLKACTYAVEVRPAATANAEEHALVVDVEAPAGGSGWQIVELRPVSEGGFVNLPHLQIS
jgi:nitrite reductase/ring-hydroxylating ferredoxin subunit